MNNFRFKLQKVLDIKIKNEDESKIKYSKLQNEKRVIERKLENLKANYEKYSEDIKCEDTISRKIVSNYLYSLSRTIEETNAELKDKNNLLNEVKLELLNKQIERKSLEKIKESKHKAFMKEAEYKEQIANDEFGMYSFLRNRAQIV
ncbi:flagellar export protein FliJ [Clostridium sp. Ade.TY]|uniref:flagellar export protein FliJ n=1 Tax=Clostridium sp. Ade.TY TaxID=1391647 RepID=UPI00040F164D|nr:flagellar export protein FliJ [Clostridium sp. Ade.TY]